MTTDERRAYSRGYQRGTARGARQSMRFLDHAVRMRRLVQGRGQIGSCALCKHWTRGGPTAFSEAKWGSCAMQSGSLADLVNFWSETPIITQEGFGCILFERANWRGEPDSSSARSE
jgi:hypothetical protein